MNIKIMRKMYVKPEMETENILLESMLAASSEHVEINPDENGPATANEHRGGWGDLWN